MIIEVTEKNFEQEVYNSKVLVLLDFYSEGCIACERMDEEIKLLIGKYDGGLKFVKINIDENRDIAAACEVQCTPTIMFFDGGSVVDLLEGFKNSTILQEHINDII